MTELSPVAQAVLDAFDAKQDEMHEVTWLTRNPDRDCIAAALRAAAEQIEDLYCADLVIYDSDGAVFVLRQLMLIADELDAQ